MSGNLDVRALFRRLNGAVGAGGYADAVAIAFRLVYDGFAVDQSYGLLRADFDAFKRACAFFRINN